MSLKTTYSHYSNSRVASLAQIIEFFTLWIESLQWIWILSILYHTEKNLVECTFETWKSPQSGLWSCHITTFNEASPNLHQHTPACTVCPSLQLPVDAASLVQVPTALLSLIVRCAVHILGTSGCLWESSTPEGAREQTAVRLQQCIPSNLPVNEDNKGDWVDQYCCQIQQKSEQSHLVCLCAMQPGYVNIAITACL